MPALDLALRLGVIRRPTICSMPLAVEPLGEIAGDVRCAIVGEQPRPVDDGGVIEPGGRKRQVERFGQSEARIVGQSFQATMKREKSSSTVDR